MLKDFNNVLLKSVIKKLKNRNIFTRDSPSASYDFSLHSYLSFGGVGSLSRESFAVAAEGGVGGGCGGESTGGSGNKEGDEGVGGGTTVGRCDKEGGIGSGGGGGGDKGWEKSQVT